MECRRSRPACHHQTPAVPNLNPNRDSAGRLSLSSFSGKHGTVRASHPQPMPSPAELAYELAPARSLDGLRFQRYNRVTASEGHLSLSQELQ